MSLPIKHPLLPNYQTHALIPYISYTDLWGAGRGGAGRGGAGRGGARLHVMRHLVQKFVFWIWTWGVGHPMDRTAGLRHLVRSKKRRWGLVNISPRPQTRPRESVGYRTWKIHKFFLLTINANLGLSHSLHGFQGFQVLSPFLYAYLGCTKNLQPR